MSLQLYFHPFSSYCQKVLIALYENAIPFEPQLLEAPDSPATRRLAELWPIKRFPVLVDGERTVVEASCIIEYLDLHRPGPVQLIPA
ncbi:MAG: glutathione S-transferase family protein, partial [Pseudomonadota bacterium]